MLFIYKEGINKILRETLKPFASLLPLKYRFPVNGSFNISIGNNKFINLTCNPTSYLARLLFWGGEKGFEFKTVRIYKELAKASTVILDIGSNIGYYSLVGAKMNPDVKIYAFEPMPAAFKYLNINIHKNQFKNINSENIALSNTKGKTTFYAVKSKKFVELADHLNGDGTINADNNITNFGEEFEVHTETLDNYVSAQKITNIDVIKIDTEASEHLVFEGGINVLKNLRPIIFCEVIPNKIETKIDAIFATLNYSFYKAYPKGLVKFNSLSESYDECIDYLIVPNEKQHLISKFIVSN
jgi:FkbM family methyltransferase